MSAKKEFNYCKKCKHWKNNQAELDYGEFIGICICPKLQWSQTNYEMVLVLDRENITNKHRGTNKFECTSCEIPVGSVCHSRYCLITDEDFGCNHFENK